MTDLKQKPNLLPASVEKRLAKLIDKKQKSKRKALENPIATNKKRRKRGYKFEADIRTMINNSDKEKIWHCRRLGGSSTGLPDLVLTYNDKAGYLVSMECKSVMDANIISIPEEEIYRCVDTCKVFGMYNITGISFAFKFMKSEKVNRKSNKTRFWLFSIWDAAIEGQRGNLERVSFDIRTENLKFHYKDDGTKIMVGNKFNGWHTSLPELMATIMIEASQYDFKDEDEDQAG